MYELGVTPAPKLNKEQIAERVMQMLNEAARCLDEGIVASARDGDIGAIFGILPSMADLSATWIS